MANSSLEARLEVVKQQITQLKERIAAIRRAKEEEAATGWETYGTPSDVAFAFTIRRQLRGHFGKVYALDWAGDNSTLVSASQDGKLIVWNAFTENKRESISLKSAWVMTCAFEREEQRYVASGGLDNVVSVFDLRNPALPAYELAGHDGYISSVRWIGERHMLTASGDSTCALWDTERGIRQQTFTDHAADVMSVATHPTEPHIFATGSCDATVRVWDIRAGCCTRTFTGVGRAGSRAG
jgi:guanine nucleotide-binding protein G(I)/G(S)/G(T) subunit beta-1